MIVDLVGETIGSYRIISQLGSGGMGQVYLAEHRHLKRKAAVKVLSREFADRPDLLERFFLEARATSLIQHPGIVQIFDCEIDATGRPYIVMEYLDGDTLAVALTRRAPLPARTVVRIARGIAQALGAAHDKGIIHRDLKPENIFVQSEPPDSIKLVDFGIAKLAGDFQAGQVHKTHAGALMGTPLYMSPEQCRDSGRINASTDLYSLGCVMYEMIAGHPPFQYGGLAELVVAHLTEQPSDLRAINPSMPAALLDLTAALLSKNATDRPPSARAVVDRLEAYVAALTTVPEAEPRGTLAVSPDDNTAIAAPETTARPKPVDTTFGVAASELVQPGQTADRRSTKRKVIWGGLVVVALGVAATGLIGNQRRDSGEGRRVSGSGDQASTGGASSAGGVASPQPIVAEPAPLPQPPTADGTVPGPDPPAKGRKGKSRQPAEIAVVAPDREGQKTVAVTIDAQPTGSPTAAVEPTVGAVSPGLWDGPWADPVKHQEGTLRLQVGDDGTVAGWMHNKVANQNFRLLGRLAPHGALDLICQCPAAQNFAVRGTVRTTGRDEFKVRLALSTAAGVFGESQAVLRRTVETGARPTAENRWPQILPGSWFQPQPSPTLYLFRANGTGVRTTYPAGTQVAGQPFPFNWALQRDRLVLRFPSGWADVVTLTGYAAARNTLDRTSSRGWGNGPWYGCASGRIPREIARQACP